MSKSCRTCSKSFTITKEEERLRESLAPQIGTYVAHFPEPKDCPSCRFRHRAMFLNERNLYYRPCDKTGKMLVSNYAPESQHTVYYAGYWLSDEWDAMDYGVELNFEEPFFVQYKKVFDRVPRMSIDQASVENSDFNNHVDHLQNCYMCVQSGELEDCTYLTFASKSKHCHNSILLIRSEESSNCRNASDCYGVHYSENVTNCANGWFLKNCEGVKDSFFCVNLRHKQYCIRNVQYTKEEYERYLEQFLKTVEENSQAVEEEFKKFAQQFPERATMNLHCEEVEGEYLDHCKSCTDIRFGSNAERVMHGFWCVDAKDCMDVCAMQIEHSYFSLVTGGGSYGCHFCMAVWDNCREVLYSDYCFFGNAYLFGCVGLKHKQYCILNKQYTKQEYEVLVPKLIEHMQNTGEWGEFFPKNMSPFAYNESTAQAYFPRTKEEIVAEGLRFREEGEKKRMEGGLRPKPARSYVRVEEITETIFHCTTTGKPYKIIPQEVAFSLRTGVPLPQYCPEERYKQLVEGLRPQHSYTRCCGNEQRYDTQKPCATMFTTCFAPGDGRLVYCEECYAEIKA